MSTPSPNLPSDRWGAKIFRIRAVLRRYWWIMVLSIMIGLGAAAVFLSRQDNLFRSTAKLMVSGRVHVTEGNAYTEDVVNFFGTQVEMMRSSQVVSQAEARVKAAGMIPPTEPAVFEISLVQNASIFLLRSTARTPEYAQAFLEALVEEYIGLKKSIRSDKSEATLLALSDELLRAEKETDEGEDALSEFQKKHSLVFLREGENNAARYLNGLSERLANLKTQARLYEEVDFEQLRGLPAPTAPQPLPPAPKVDANGEPTAETTPSPVVTSQMPEFLAQNNYLRTRQELLMMEQKRAQLLEVKREGHPDLVALDEDISATKRLLGMLKEQGREEFEMQRKSLAAQIKALTEEVEVWRAKAVEIGGLLGEFSRLQAKVTRSKALHERLLSNMGNVGLTKTLDQDVVSVLERPSPAEPVKPGLGRILAAGAAAGLLLGGLVLFLLDRNSSQIVSPEEFMSSFPERVLGLVPIDTKAKDHLQVSDGRHAFAEAFYHIRSSLLFLDYDGPMPKTLLITSAVPNEGKSTLSTNIALAFAFAGSRTLLIDGDLRRGQIHRSFSIPNDRGFSEVIQRIVPWRDAVVETNVMNLSLMPRGGLLAQPSKYLVHSSTDALMQELHEEYDQIIIDSCPLLAADDTTSLAPKVEAVVLVARVGVATRRHVSIALNWLASRQANILGVVLNGVDPKSTSYNYYTYSSYYGDEAAAADAPEAARTNS